MNTSIPNISKTYLLDEFLSSSDFTVHLFKNNIVGDENPIIFVEPSFSGYSSVSINPNNWNASILDINYATCTYNKPLIFNNSGNVTSETIFGYFVKNLSGDTLWYEKFNSPKIINVEEGLAINIKVNLNKPGSGYNFVTLILTSSIPDIKIKNSTISIQSENWNGSNVSGSLIDITGRSFVSNNSIFSLLLKSNIRPSASRPYTFNMTINSEGFNTLNYSGSISTDGLNSFIVPLDAIFPPPPAPTEPTRSDGDLIELFGPFDSKGNTTFVCITEDSKFSFTFFTESITNPSPFNMLIYINNVLCASVDYFAYYNNKSFNLQFESYNLSGNFSPNNVYLTVPGPGPVPPTPA